MILLFLRNLTSAANNKTKIKLQDLFLLKIFQIKNKMSVTEQKNQTQQQKNKAAK